MSTTPAPHGAMVRKETLGNLVATMVIAALLCWLIFRGETRIPAFAPPPGGIFGILPGTFNFTLLVTVALTLITRRRMRAGLYRRLEPGEGPNFGAKLPQRLMLRAVALALVATLLFVPVGAVGTWLAIQLGVVAAEWTFLGMTLFFIGYFALLAWVVTPVVLWRALRD